RFLPDVEIRALEYRCERLKAATDIKDESQRLVLLRVLQQKHAKIGLATPCHPENQGVGNVAGVQVEEVGRAGVGFDDWQGFRAELRIRLFTGQDRKQERQVRIICVQQKQFPEIQCIVARHDGEISVQLVVGFGKQIAIRVGEDTGELGYKSF